MKTEKLFMMQKELDSHIQSLHGLAGEDLFDRKVLALLVEAGELANETRCFKFWSMKPSSEKTIILEEFVDGIHFILSLGIEAGFDGIKEITNEVPAGMDASSQFLEVYAAIQRFRSSRSKEDYQHLFKHYLELAEILGLKDSEIEQAYIEKNEVNYDRQKNGY
ncbi:dUTP diphosphatase [Bacillus sp. REN3]|uniref:dUTP diphosphatase n=1 Tax=Bacillus sp. REN3 TaxID=2802440 RepID=UPI001AEEF0FF|nr:dUTP diphosphatase [Bacillus sp. REN3]